MTSQSKKIVFSPNCFKSTLSRKTRPIKRCISKVRPACFPRLASLSARVCVARGNIPYSAVIQPCWDPFKNLGTPGTILAVQSTLVLPKATNTDPSA